MLLERLLDARSPLQVNETLPIHLSRLFRPSEHLPEHVRPDGDDAVEVGEDDVVRVNGRCGKIEVGGRGRTGGGRGGEGEWNLDARGTGKGGLAEDRVSASVDLCSME